MPLRLPWLPPPDFICGAAIPPPTPVVCDAPLSPSGTPTESPSDSPSRSFVALSRPLVRARARATVGALASTKSRDGRGHIHRSRLVPLRHPRSAVIHPATVCGLHCVKITGRDPSRCPDRLDRLDSTRLDSIRLDSTRLYSTRFDSIRLDSTRFDSIRFDSIRFGSTPLHSARLDSTGLDPASVRFDPTRPDRIRTDPIRFHSIRHDPTRFDSIRRDGT